LVPDPAIVSTAAALGGAARERMPAGSDGMAHYAEESPAAKSEPFLRDLDYLLGLVRALKVSVDDALKALLN